MPLSKERDRERWHKRKLQPKTEALHSKSNPIEETLNATASLQPNSNLSIIPCEEKVSRGS